LTNAKPKPVSAHTVMIVLLIAAFLLGALSAALTLHLVTS